MGGFTKIQLKNCSQGNIDKQNEKLDEIGLRKDIRFYSEKNIREEYVYYRSNPDGKRDKYFPPNLFPKPINDYTEFKSRWTNLGEVFAPAIGSLQFDCTFNRTSDNAMKKIAKYLLDNGDNIETSGSYSTFVDRVQVSRKQKDLLSDLENRSEPEKLPEEEQYIPVSEAGQFLCKSYSIEPFWVTFGNIDEPRFMKEKIYKDDIYNKIYRNKKGHAFMLMPLMPLGVQTDWHEKVINRAMELGLREHPVFILSYLYGVQSNDEEKYIEEIKEYYTHNEILERFKIVHDNLKESYGYETINGFKLNILKNKFEPRLGDRASEKMHAHCQILNILLKTLGYDYDHQKGELILN